MNYHEAWKAPQWKRRSAIRGTALVVRFSAAASSSYD